MPISGGGKLTVTLDQLVDYAKELDNNKDAEKIELMCYRMFARNMTAARHRIQKVLPQEALANCSRE